MQRRVMRNLDKDIVVNEFDEVKEPKGVIQILHGMVEYAMRYDGVIKLLNQSGYIVVAEDHRGHGETDKDNLGYSAGNIFEDTLSDVVQLMNQTKQKYPNLPYYIFGFSYGSFLTQAFMRNHINEVNGIILGGTSKQSKFLVGIGYLVASIGCAFKGEKAPAKFIKKLTFDAYDKHFEDKCFLSTNNESNEKYKKDKFCSFVCSNRFYKDFFDGLKKLYNKDYTKAIKNSKTPILLISGEKDPVGNMGKGVNKLEKYYKDNNLNVEKVLFENSRHEFLNEDINRIKYIVDFCNNYK